jgi:hypothetical protein
MLDCMHLEAEHTTNDDVEQQHAIHVANLEMDTEMEVWSRVCIAMLRWLIL